MEASSSRKSLASVATKTASDPLDIKGLVNQIFARKGSDPVKNFPKEFADGSKSKLNTFWHSFIDICVVRFQELFNILFDEKIDCKLVKSALVEDRMLNWNRLNGKAIELCILIITESAS